MFLLRGGSLVESPALFGETDKDAIPPLARGLPWLPFCLVLLLAGGTTTSDPSVEPAENTPTPSAVESPIKVATDSAEPVANTPTPSGSRSRVYGRDRFRRHHLRAP